MTDAELADLLMIAHRAAFKAWTMYQRHECQRRSEIDDLIAAKDRFMEARRAFLKGAVE